jgi:acetyltransferase-like isoleucine patch superfamily enzyme
MEESVLRCLCRDKAQQIVKILKDNRIRNEDVFIASQIEVIAEKWGKILMGRKKEYVTCGIIGADANSIQMLLASHNLVWCYDEILTEEYYGWDSSDPERRIKVEKKFDPLVPMVFASSFPPAKRKALMEAHPERLLLANAAIHPAAYVAMDALVGIGSIVFPAAYIGANARIGEAVSIGSHATVLGDVGCFSEIGHNSVVSEGARIGVGVKLGVGVLVAPGVIVGDNQVVAAGQIVRANLSERSFTSAK